MSVILIPPEGDEPPSKTIPADYPNRGTAAATASWSFVVLLFGSVLPEQFTALQQATKRLP